jgi:hypothetical protein
MRKPVAAVVTVSLAVAFVAAVDAPAYAQAAPGIHMEVLRVIEGAGRPVNSFARSGIVLAKFVCGSSRGGELAPGRYFTALNVTNGSEEGSQPLALLMDIIQTNGQRRVVRNVAVGAMAPLTGREIDCETIATLTKTDLAADLIKGFVRISADPSLSTPLREPAFVGVAVYTTAPAGPAGEPIPAP